LAGDLKTKDYLYILSLISPFPTSQLPTIGVGYCPTFQNRNGKRFTNKKPESTASDYTIILGAIKALPEVRHKFDKDVNLLNHGSVCPELQLPAQSIEMDWSFSLDIEADSDV
jgi:hypothetical protein